MRSDPDPGYKVVLLGNSGAGKTSILGYAMSGAPNLRVIPTIGCQASVLPVQTPSRLVTLKLWDTAGQEIFSSIVPIYIRNATAALLVFDVTDFKSFSSLDRWHSILLEEQEAAILVYVIGNKIDLLDQVVISEEDGKAAATRLNGYYYPVSAMTGHGISELFTQIGKDIADFAVSHAFPHRPIPLAPAEPAEEGSCC
jgi:small GTP-binding protein